MKAEKNYREEVRQLFDADPKFDREKAARQLGCSTKTLFKHLRSIRKEYGLLDTDEEDGPSKVLLDQEEISVEESENRVFINSNKTDIKSAQEAIKYANIDLKIWKIVKQRISTSQVSMKLKEKAGEDSAGNVIVVDRVETVTHWHVKVWLERIIENCLEKTLKLLAKEVPKCKIPKPAKFYPKGQYAYEIALLDAHIGKLAWGAETNAPNYDTKIGCETYLDACTRLLAQTNGIKLESIKFIFGHDFMHVENLQGTTSTGGHILDHDSRLPYIYMKAKKTILESIYMCREIAPVEIIWIPGNHDIHISYVMADMIKEHFKDCKWVDVDNEPTWRKVRVWGDLMVGFAHDASTRKKVPTINMLPQFWPEEWGKSKWREWHVGHKHKKMEERFMPTATVGSVIVRQISTLGPIDAWHYQNMYVDAVPAGEAFLWSKKDGVIAHNNANIHFKE